MQTGVVQLVEQVRDFVGVAAVRVDANGNPEPRVGATDMREDAIERGLPAGERPALPWRASPVSDG